MGLMAVVLLVVVDFDAAGVVGIDAFGMSVDLFVKSVLLMLLESVDFFGSVDLELSDLVSAVMLFLGSLEIVLGRTGVDGLAGSMTVGFIGVVEAVGVLLAAAFAAAAALKAAMRSCSAFKRSSSALMRASSACFAASAAASAPAQWPR